MLIIILIGDSSIYAAGYQINIPLINPFLDEWKNSRVNGNDTIFSDNV